MFNYRMVVFIMFIPEKYQDKTKFTVGNVGSLGRFCQFFSLSCEAYLMSHFTFVIYDPQMATVHADATEWGWTLVGYAESLPSEPKVDVARR